MYCMVFSKIAFKYNNANCRSHYYICKKKGKKGLSGDSPKSLLGPYNFNTRPFKGLVADILRSTISRLKQRTW